MRKDADVQSLFGEIFEDFGNFLSIINITAFFAPYQVVSCDDLSYLWKYHPIKVPQMYRVSRKKCAAVFA